MSLYIGKTLSVSHHPLWKSQRNGF